MTTHVAPGAYVNQLEFPAYAKRLGTARPAIIGGATKGVLNKPTAIYSEEELIDTFGAPVLNDYGLQAAVAYMRKGGQMVYVRVADDDPAVGAATASQAIPGTTGGTAAVAATGTITFTGNNNPTDGETITFLNGVGRAAATCDIPFAVNMVDEDFLTVDDGTALYSEAELEFTGQPVPTDLLTLDDGVGNIYVFEFGGAGLNINVVIGGTATDTRDNLVIAINANCTYITATPILILGNPGITLTYLMPGLLGDNATAVASALQPVVNSNFAGGGGGGAVFEFDDNAATYPGTVPVTIEATIAGTLANFLVAYLTQTQLDATVSDTSGGGLYSCSLTQNLAGAAGNSGITEQYGSVVATIPFSGGLEGNTVVVEFDDNGVITPGNYGVLIGTNAAATLVNMINVINGIATLPFTASNGSVTVPVADLEADTAGRAYNLPITELGANITAVGMTGGTDAVPGIGATVGWVYASSPGTWGNSVSVLFRNTLTFGAPVGNFDVFVYTPKKGSTTLEIVERFANLSLDPTSDRFIEEVLENGIEGEVAASTRITFSALTTGTPTAATYILGTGAGQIGRDGITGLDYTDYIGVFNGPSSTGMQTLRNAEAVDCNAIAVPGVSHHLVITAMFELATARGDSEVVVDCPLGYTRDMVADWHNGLDPFDPDAPTTVLDTHDATMFWSWCEWYDEYNKRMIFLPPSAWVLAQMAFTALNYHPWYTIAGENRGVTDALRLENDYSPSVEDREVLLGDQNRVNPIIQFYDMSHPTLYGNKTLRRDNSVRSDLHVEMMLKYAFKVCSTAVRKLVFDPSVQVTWDAYAALCNDQLAFIASTYGLDSFRVICDETTNPPAVRNNRRMKGKLQLVPTPVGEVVELDFNIYQYGIEIEG